MDNLGIDISKDNFDVAFLKVNQYHTATFSNDTDGFVKLQKWLKKHDANQLHACLEATGRYGEALALFLHEAGYQVSVVNPSRIQAYAASQLRRNKTDKEDAKVIAHFCATQAHLIYGQSRSPDSTFQTSKFFTTMNLPISSSQSGQLTATHFVLLTQPSPQLSS